MTAKRISIGSIRREQIIDAAVAIIAEQGLQNLSLSEIENRVGMSRGQLTYYFKAKEDILLAVFDRLVELMCQQHGPAEKNGRWPAQKWLELVEMILGLILQQPPANPAFDVLQFTFLAQIGHRADFRGRLASLYEEWRTHMAGAIAEAMQERPAARPVSPRALATLTQAILHGIAVQKAADPQAFDAREIVKLSLDLLGSYLWPAAPKRRRLNKPRTTRTMQTSRNGARVHANGVHP
jgi:AcrR family transcriptional regulator